LKKICDIVIKSLTPCSIGWYRPYLHDYLLRSTTLRGVARWWLRALIAGAAYEKGVDESNMTKNIQMKVFGGVSKNIVYSSLISFRIRDAKIESLSDKEVNYLLNLPRVKLLTMDIREDKERKEFIKKAFRKIEHATIEVYSAAKMRTNPYVILLENLAICSIFLALTLSGIGKGSRRGLGAIIINQMDISPEISDEQKDLLKELQENLPKNDDDISLVAKKVKCLIKLAHNVAKEALDEALSCSKLKMYNEKEPRLPYIPAITSDDNFQVFLAKDLKLIELQAIFQRNPPKRAPLPTLAMRLQGLMNPSQAATILGSYILGLPRQAERKNIFNLVSPSLHHCMKLKNFQKDIPTGYMLLAEERRASPVISSYLTQKIAVFSIFRSSDWPKELEWSSLHLYPIPKPRAGIRASYILWKKLRVDIFTGQTNFIFQKECPSKKIKKQQAIIAKAIEEAYTEITNYFSQQKKFIKAWP